jgi:hypothetical protein
MGFSGDVSNIGKEAEGLFEFLKRTFTGLASVGNLSIGHNIR